MIDQMIAGTPVACDIFTASVGTLGLNGDERKRTVFRSSKAFSTHCTANMLTTNVATRGEAKRATMNNPITSAIPATNVNGILESELHPAINGLTKPNMR